MEEGVEGGAARIDGSNASGRKDDHPLCVLAAQVVQKGCLARAGLARQEEAVTGLGDNLVGNFYLGIRHREVDCRL